MYSSLVVIAKIMKAIRTAAGERHEMAVGLGQTHGNSEFKQLITGLSVQISPCIIADHFETAHTQVDTRLIFCPVRPTVYYHECGSSSADRPKLMVEARKQ